MIVVPRRVVDKPRGLCWFRVGHKVMLQCPVGHRALIEEHAIAAGGHVTPSVICPGDGGEPCAFHEHVFLEDFDAAD